MGEMVNIGPRVWFLAILPIYTVILVGLVTGLIFTGHAGAGFMVAGGALMLGNGLGAYRCATMIDNWCVRGLVFVKLLYNFFLAVRGMLWFLAGFAVEETVPFSIAAVLDLGITTFILAVLSGLGFLVWYDLRPVEQLEIEPQHQSSVLAAKINLAFWRRNRV